MLRGSILRKTLLFFCIPILLSTAPLVSPNSAGVPVTHAAPQQTQPPHHKNTHRTAPCCTKHTPTELAKLRYKLVTVALHKIGTPYQWGATGPDSFDCSGFMQWVYKTIGIKIPRTTWSQAVAGTQVPSTTNLQIGDLILYAGGSHVGMYVGFGAMIHAPTFRETVRINSVHNQPIYVIRRILQ